jgi:hypothetical protein
MLEWWNMGFWEFGRVVLSVKTHYQKKLKNWTFTSYPIIPPFQYSIIPIGRSL